MSGNSTFRRPCASSQRSKRFAETGEGDVRKLKGTDELRLRVGDYRVRFVEPDAATMQIKRVLHRSVAYR